MTETSFLAKLVARLGNPAVGKTVPEARKHSELAHVSGGNSPAAAPQSMQADLPEPSTFNYEDTRIPDAAKAKILQIRSLAAMIADQASHTDDSFASAAGEALSEARRIERIYMPQLMTSYFDIPPTHRAEIFRSTGRSASYLLNERLEKLVAQLNEISASLARGKIDTFALNLGFIDQRFGDSKSPFDPA